MNTEDILQKCLDEVLAGRKTPAECARHYPQLEGLEADLNAAVALQSMQALTLSPLASQRLEARLRRRAGALAAARRPARRAAGPIWFPRWAWGPALAMALLLTGIGTTAAAGASNPGDLLYRVKRVDETVQVFLSPASARADVYVGLARRRLDEITVVLQRPLVDAGTLNRLDNDLTMQTAQAFAAVDQAPVERRADILNTLAELTDQQQAVLAAVAQAAPAEAQAGLQQAIQASIDGHARAIDRLGQGAANHQPTGTPTPSATASVTPAATSTSTETPSATPTATGTPTGSVTETSDLTHVPPGQTKIPPGQTKIPPGKTQAPPGQTKVPPGETKIPPGLTHLPSNVTDGPPGQTQIAPGQTKIPPGHDKTPKPAPHGGQRIQAQ